jgi:hypothetical protein
MKNLLPKDGEEYLGYLEILPKNKAPYIMLN